MEYYCHVRNGALSCYLELLDEPQNRMCRIVGPRYLSWTLGSWSICSQLKSVDYFGRCSSELAELVPLPYSRGRSTRYSDRLHNFSVTIPRYYKDIYVNSSFSRIASLWNSLPVKCFPLTYDLNGFKSRINRHLLTAGSFFLHVSTFMCFFSCNSMPRSGCSALHGVNHN